MDLLFRTGDSRADDALEAIAASFAAEFPDHQHRCVLLGSYVAGTARGTSDLDVLVIFSQSLSDVETRRSGEIAAKVKGALAIEADIGVCSSNHCPPVWAVCIRAGQTVSGNAEIQPKMPTMEDYAAALVADVISLMQGLRPGQELRFPLEYPNKELVLFGYEAKPLRGPDNSWLPSTKALSMITTWGATALLAARCGTFIQSKDAVIETYREKIGDQWTELLVEVDQLCRLQLSYVIPKDEPQIKRLQRLASRVLDFENHLFSTFAS